MKTKIPLLASLAWLVATSPLMAQSNPCTWNPWTVATAPTISVSVASPGNQCIGTQISVTATANESNGTKTRTDSCGNAETAPLVLSSPNWTWSLSGVTADVTSGAVNGSSTCTAVFTPNSSGVATIDFTATATTTDPAGAYTASGRVVLDIDAVTSLTPSAGLWVDDGDGDPNTDTYLVALDCYDTITITASDALALKSADMPACWQMTGGTEIDRKTHTVTGASGGKTVVSVLAGTSYKKVTLIIYEAILEADADKGDCSTTQHAWWNLTVTPSDINIYLRKANGVDLSGRLGEAGYYGDDSWSCGSSGGCPGHVEFGPQPITGTTDYYSATGSYWWCISFGSLIAALSYVDDLANDPGTYQLYNLNPA